MKKTINNWNQAVKHGTRALYCGQGGQKNSDMSANIIGAVVERHPDINLFISEVSEQTLYNLRNIRLEETRLLTGAARAEDVNTPILLSTVTQTKAVIKRWYKALAYRTNFTLIVTPTKLIGKPQFFPYAAHIDCYKFNNKRNPKEIAAKDFSPYQELIFPPVLNWIELKIFSDITKQFTRNLFDNAVDMEGCLFSTTKRHSILKALTKGHDKKLSVGQFQDGQVAKKELIGGILEIPLQTVITLC